MYNIENKYIEELIKIKDSNNTHIKKHIQADTVLCDLLLELGYPKIVNLFKSI